MVEFMDTSSFPTDDKNKESDLKSPKKNMGGMGEGTEDGSKLGGGQSQESSGENSPTQSLRADPPAGSSKGGQDDKKGEEKQSKGQEKNEANKSLASSDFEGLSDQDSLSSSESSEGGFSAM